MSRTTPDQIVAHADLLRAVDRLLAQAEAVRAKREALDRLLFPNPEDHRPADERESHRD
jgi:hypothetical protein